MDMAVGVFSSLLVQLPVILAWLVGIVLSLSYWRQRPRVSRLTLVAICVLLAERLVGTYLSLYLPLTLRERGLSSNQIGISLSIVGFVRSLAQAGSWGLLLAAIFGRRAER
jgi:hypothetical protein